MRILLILLAIVGFVIGLYLAVVTLAISARAFRSQPSVNAPNNMGRLIGPETVLVGGAAAAIALGGNVLVVRRAWRRWPGGWSIPCLLMGAVELLVAALWGGWVLSDALGHWDYMWEWNRERTAWLLAINAFLALKGVLTIAAEVRAVFQTQGAREQTII